MIDQHEAARVMMMHGHIWVIYGSYDQHEAARSAGEGAKDAEREQEKLGIRGGRKAGTIMRGGYRALGHPRREESWAPDEGGQRILDGLWRGDRYWWCWGAAGGGLVGGAASVVHSGC